VVAGSLCNEPALQPRGLAGGNHALARLNHLAATQAAGADFNPLYRTVDDGTDTLDVGAEYPLGATLRVADIVADHPTFTAVITNVSHAKTLKSKTEYGRGGVYDM